MELSREKSEELAALIELMKPYIQLIDIDYANAVYKAMKDQASWQQSASVLNPSFDSVRNDLLYTQAQCLKAMITFISLAKECDQLKSQIQHNQEARNKVAALFI
jgi:hypothetical protein